MKTFTKLSSIILLSSLFYNCNDKYLLEPEESLAPKTVGQSYGGGTVFYVDGTGLHGLIAAPDEEESNLGTGGTTTSFTFQVSGMTGNVNATISYVSLNISHLNVGSLAIQLRAPNGNTIYLSNQNGGSGQNYTGTTFITGNSSITTGTAPFSGYYAPFQPFSLLSNSVINGVWTVLITNYSTIYHGTLTQFTLGFTTDSFSPAISKRKTWDKGGNNFINASGSLYGTGQSNTTTIVNALNYGSYAARVCEDLVVNGYSDWYLPSIDELVLMKNNKSIIPNISSSAIYWSSTEQNSTNAYGKSFSSGSTTNSAYSKSSLFRVRAIRSF